MPPNYRRPTVSATAFDRSFYRVGYRARLVIIPIAQNAHSDVSKCKLTAQRFSRSRGGSESGGSFAEQAIGFGEITR